MKKFIGFLILIIVLVAVSGCTQPATTTPAATTTVPEVTTEIPTEVATAVATPVETTAAPTKVPTTKAATVATTVKANVTSAANATTVAPVTTATISAAMTPSTKITVVHIVNNTFSPSPLMILPGTRITWVNDDGAIHSVKAIGASSGKFNSGDLSPKGQWGYDFGENVGTFEYADGYNLNVTGTIIVKKGDSLVGMVVSQTPYVTSNATW